MIVAKNKEKIKSNLVWFINENFYFWPLPRKKIAKLSRQVFSARILNDIARHLNDFLQKSYINLFDKWQTYLSKIFWLFFSCINHSKICSSFQDSLNFLAIFTLHANFNWEFNYLLDINLNIYDSNYWFKKS